MGRRCFIENTITAPFFQKKPLPLHCLQICEDDLMFRWYHRQKLFHCYSRLSDNLPQYPAAQLPV